MYLTNFLCTFYLIFRPIAGNFLELSYVFLEYCVVFLWVVFSGVFPSGFRVYLRFWPLLMECQLAQPMLLHLHWEYTCSIFRGIALLRRARNDTPSPDCVVGISRELTDRSPGYLQYSSSQCHPFVEDSTLAGSWTVSVGVGPIQLRESGNSATGSSEPEPGQVTVTLVESPCAVAPQQAGETAS